MSKYKILLLYPGGGSDEQDEVFDTEEDAVDYALYLVSCGRQGAEILNLSNPGDYPLDDYEEPDFTILEIDD